MDEFFDYFPGTKTIQTFDDRGDNPKLARIFHFKGNIKESMLRTLKVMNNEGAGIYMCISETDGKGRRASNVIKVRAVFADLDGAPLAPALTFNPSIVVESSPGRYHAYWLAKDVPMNGFSALQKNIARDVGSDPKVHDIPRVMRVPGFYHRKSKPFLSRTCGGSGVVFTYRELVEWFPPVRVPKWSSKRYQIDRGPASMGEFRGNYGAANGERNHHVFRRVCGMIKAKKPWSHIEAEAEREANACSPPLPAHEIRAILRSAQRYIGV
jgi:hypothetical protein